MTALRLPPNTASIVSSRMTPYLLVTALAGTSLLTACGGATGPFVSVKDVPAAEAQGTDFLIRDTDTLTVRVYQQDQVTTQQRVRADGRIVVPLVGEFMARGKRPTALAEEVREKLRASGQLKEPAVTVTVDQSAQIGVSVLGQVRNPGHFNVDQGGGVLQALASAGGLSDYADEDKVFVVRRSLKERVRFKFSDLRNADKASVGFVLQPGDAVVVE
jgi:polysaccharide biosynthesis/export protein